MNRNLECSVPIGEYNYINLKIFKPLSNPPEQISIYSVPLRYEMIPVVLENDVDLSLQVVLKYISESATLTIVEIAEICKMDVKIVIQHIKQLVSFGYVKLVDKYDETNMYCSTPKIMDFLKDKKEQQHLSNKIEDSIQRVISFYMCFSDGKTVKEVKDLVNLESTKEINRPKILTNFGIVLNILKRLHLYPIKSGPFENKLFEENRNLFDGKHSMEEICEELHIERSKFQEMLTYESNVKIITI